MSEILLKPKNYLELCNLYCAQGLPRKSSLKKKSVSGGSFIRGKSVNKELKQLILTHLKLCLATVTHNFKWVKITNIR